MAKPLPPETLQQIFSSDLGQHELALLCRVDKRFATIVKPTLYRSITINTLRQAEQFVEQGQKEDVKLVKSVRVVGRNNPWLLGGLEQVWVWFEIMEKEERLKERQAGCVKKLVEGELVEPSQIESLSIHNVSENPRVLWSESFQVKPQLFANLRDLSIIRYRGGGNVVSGLLKIEHLPNLERLAICDISYYDPGTTREEARQLQLEAERTGSLVFFNARSESRVVRKIVDEVKLFERPKLKLLVSPNYAFEKPLPPSLSYLNILTTFTYRFFSDKFFSDKHVILHATDTGGSHEIDDLFNKLKHASDNFSSYSLRYLAIPSELSGQLSTPHKAILDSLSHLGVAIYFDGDLGRSIAPPSFFEFRQKEEEEEDAKKSLS